MSTTRAVMMIIVSVALSVAGQTFLKLGLDRANASDAGGTIAFLLAAFSQGAVWLGLVLFAGSVLVWMRVLSSTELSWGYPLLGLSYVLVALSGWLVFGEELSRQRLLGIAFVILGALLVGRS